MKLVMTLKVKAWLFDRIQDEAYRYHVALACDYEAGCRVEEDGYVYAQVSNQIDAETDKAVRFSFMTANCSDARGWSSWVPKKAIGGIVE